MTDRETLSKLKAEFPQLDISLGDKQNQTEHQAHAVRACASEPTRHRPRLLTALRLQGPRKAFEWGPVPAEKDPEGEGAAAVPPPKSAAPPCTPATAAGPSTFEWGALPAAGPAHTATAAPPQPGGSSAAQSSFEWGAPPVHAETVALSADTGGDAAAASPDLVDASPPSGRSTFEWGTLPS